MNLYLFWDYNFLFFAILCIPLSIGLFVLIINSYIYSFQDINDEQIINDYLLWV